MTDYGEMNLFLEMEVKQNEKWIIIGQKKYEKEISKKFQMKRYKHVDIPMVRKLKSCKENGAEKVDETNFRSLIGWLMYLTSTRLDILDVCEYSLKIQTCAKEVLL